MGWYGVFTNKVDTIKEIYNYENSNYKVVFDKKTGSRNCSYILYTVIDKNSGEESRYMETFLWSSNKNENIYKRFITDFGDAGAPVEWLKLPNIRNYYMKNSDLLSHEFEKEYNNWINQVIISQEKKNFIKQLRDYSKITFSTNQNIQLSGNNILEKNKKYTGMVCKFMIPRKHITIFVNGIGHININVLYDESVYINYNNCE